MRTASPKRLERSNRAPAFASGTFQRTGRTIGAAATGCQTRCRDGRCPDGGARWRRSASLPPAPSSDTSSPSGPSSTGTRCRCSRACSRSSATATSRAWARHSRPCRTGSPPGAVTTSRSMAMAAVAFAKAKRRRQIMVATSSIGPGALNMVTAAGIAHANRLPVLLLSGDTFVNRVPDPVLQQVEPFGDPSVTVNDAFRPVTRYWDRIVHPAQVLQSLPQAVATMLDPADCGPAFLGLPQDVQAEAFDFPAVVLRASGAPDPAGRTRPDGARRGGGGAPGGGATAADRRRRRALLPRDRAARRVRRAARRAGRRDGRRQVVAPMGPPDVRRPHRGHGELVGERAGRRRRRGPRGRHPPAGFHDRLLERLRRRATCASSR